MKKTGWILLMFVFLFAGSCGTADPASEKAINRRVQTVMDDKTITVTIDGKEVLSYYYAMHDVPEGVDPLYRRSGFIHPLWSPDGQVMTRIQPPDHYHHYGIWGPWTKTHIEGREVDFWNLVRGQGTVRFAGLENLLNESESGGFRVRQEHVDFTASQEGKVSIEEILEVRASPGQAEGRPAWIIDYTSRQTNVLDVPIELDQYRYGGGLGYRAPEEWTKDTCTVLTSEGKARNEADGQRARWCNVNGRFADGRQAGILLMSHPENHEHPEPIRVWPDNSVGGTGQLMIDICPIRLKNRAFKPGKTYTFQYRLVVYDGTITPQTAETLWDQYIQTK